jgi:hypothetical protein
LPCGIDVKQVRDNALRGVFHVFRDGSPQALKFGDSQLLCDDLYTKHFEWRHVSPPKNQLPNVRCAGSDQKADQGHNDNRQGFCNPM